MSTRPVYSVKFFTGTLPGFPYNTLIVAGDGVNTFVIREITAWSPLRGGLMAPASSFTVFNVDTDEDTTVIWSKAPPETVAGRSYAWSGRRVLGPLDQVQATATDGTWDLTVSGYFLTAAT